MIYAQTPAGKKGFLLRGAWTPRGKVRIAMASVTTPAGDKTVWDAAASSSGFVATALPATVRGATAAPGGASVTTDSATVTVEGAVGTVTYSWAKTSGSSAWSIEKPSAATTRFIVSSVPAYGIEAASFEVTATDSAGRTATDTVNASARNYGDPSAPTP